MLRFSPARCFSPAGGFFRPLVPWVVVLVAALGLSAGLSGCTIHSSYDPSDVGPRGVILTATTVAGRTLDAEVLALEADTLMLRVLRVSEMLNSVLVALPLDRLDSGRFRGARSLNMSASYWQPTAAWREGVRLRSRFPQGLTPTIRAALLRRSNQSRFPTLS
jgi:hypothetical protein